MSTIPPFSYSSLTKFETCSKQYQIVRVLKKVVEPPTEQTIWGQKVHLALEERVRDGKPLPDDMQKWEPIAARIASLKGDIHCEQEFSFDRNLDQCEWKDPEAWARGIIDVWVLNGSKAAAFDWKTGKVKHDIDQLKLFAAFIMQAHPQVETVSTGFIWLAHNKTTNEVFTRNQLPNIWEEFASRDLRRVNAYTQDRWIPKPSGLCAGWCPVGPANCQFWRPKKK